jgi:hypothetical protein
MKPEALTTRETSANALLVSALSLALVVVAQSQTATFNFETNTPSLITGLNVPFDQTAGTVTAHFSSPQGAAFSLQTDVTTGWSLSQFSGRYLNDNVPPGTTSLLDVSFNRRLASISLTFATADFNQVEATSLLQLSAFLGTTATPVGTPVTTRGVYGADTMPMGTITFSSAQPFDLVEITIPSGQPQGTTDFLVDNIIVTLVPIPEPGSLALFGAGFGLFSLWTLARRRRGA